ncbi:MAG: bifunctional 5,10-methylenetetrahydrofolate dehydrogenase/5,10-methenyltetrahydrofolate cyclohydrolase [Patescibacteria group bacterium]
MQYEFTQPLNKPLILDGKACAQHIRAEIADGVRTLGFKPGLAVILLGNDAASRMYVKSKGEAARNAGFHSVVDIRPATTTQAELLKLIAQYNADPKIHGYIVQLPLPAHIDVEAVVAAIDPLKDVDGFHPENQGLLLRGTPRFVPATPRGIIELLRRNGITAKGKRVVIVGRSSIVGKPLAAAFLMKGEMGDATVTVAHSQTPDLATVCKEADILVTALGKSGFVKLGFVKPGAVVVDVGISRVDGVTSGDVDFGPVCLIASAITPVPGGVGPMTIAMLLQNTLDAAMAK